MMIVKMKKEDFKVGDRVEITDKWKEYEGVTGTIFSLLENSCDDTIIMLLDEPCALAWNDEEMGITDKRGFFYKL